MRRFCGQTLRLAGLLMEMGGLLAMTAWSRTDEAGAKTLPWGLSPRLVWMLVIAGFVVWLAGNLLLYWPTKRARQRKRGQEKVRNLEL